MEHLLLKAATTATDQGTFEAVISTASIDREGDIVEPSAIVKALGKWAALGKKMPLAYSHVDPATGQAVVVGHIDPASARVDGKEVAVKGWVDQSTERGAETWRLVKSGTLSFSYGYLVPKGGATKRAGGKSGYHITEIDLFEISVVPIAPANNDTRVLSYKAVKQTDAPPTPDQMRILNSLVGLVQEYIASGPDAEDAAELADVLETLEELRGEPDSEDEVNGEEVGKALRRQANDVGREEDDRKLGLHAQGGEGFSEATTKSARSVAGDIEFAKQALEAQEMFEPEEIAGLKGGILKAVWSAAFINDLPDSAFLYVEPGDKDAEGKTTPRSKRYFPYKDDSGAVDLPHLRNALARIPQSSLSQDVKDRLVAKAQRILDNSKSVPVAADETDKEAKPRSVDPLRKQAESTALEFASGGLSLREPPKQEAPPQVEPELPLADLKKRMREEMLIHLSGETT